MQFLSSLDASFLHVETPSAPMHVGSLMLLDVSGERRTGFLDELQRYMTARMQAVPLFSRKLETVAFGLADPAWVDEPAVDLDYHVRSHTLAATSSMRELERFVEEEHARLLDRKRPLWELHMIDGLADGKLALYAKIHHAALEGIGPTALMQALAADMPGAQAQADGTSAGERPGAASLLAGSVRHSMGQAFGMMRQLPDGLRALASMRDRVPSTPPRTPFNAAITAERSFTTLQFRLEDLTLVARAFAGSVNDTLMAIVAGALRRFLSSGSGLPHRPLVAAVPVSLREREDGHVSSKVALWRADLATNEEDAPARMRATVRNTHAMRADIATLRPLMLTDIPSMGMPLLMGSAAVVAERTSLANTLPPVANLIVSDVAGPAHPPHIAGAKVLAAYPVSIVAHGLALNVTGQSCCDKLNVGIVAATSAVPDLQRFAACLREAGAELVQAARALEEGAESPAAGAASRSARAGQSGSASSAA